MDLRRLNTSVIDGGLGISYFNKPCRRDKIYDYNFKLESRLPGEIKNNCDNKIATDYVEFLKFKINDIEINKGLVDNEVEIVDELQMHNMSTNMTRK